jgi:leader peptidase (prepilin peptidase)/N-methyltransferase
VNLILALPIEVRMAALFVLGICAGTLMVAARERLADPTLKAGANGRRGSEWLPLVGWWRWSQRITTSNGASGRRRQLLAELTLGFLFAGLYWWEIEERGFVSPPLGPGVEPGLALLGVMHTQLFSHLLLIWLMGLASWIDIDERVIPDSITVPGAMLGLLLAALMPNSLPPVIALVVPNGEQLVGTVTPFSPESWPANWNGFPHGQSLAVGLACLWGWCFALMPRLWRPGRGLVKAVRMFFAYWCRWPGLPMVIAAAAVGTPLVLFAWWKDGLIWQGMFTTLVGLAVGGCMIWAVRIVGGWSLGREAMGFGDVTLLAMIGAFLGWQACLLVFFLAPFAGLVIGVGRWALRLGNEIWYGPFLCLATLGVIVYWASLWEWLSPRLFQIFQLGWIAIAMLAVSLAVMAVLLILLRFLRR